MKFLKRYKQVIKLLKESTEQESLAAEVLRDINDNSSKRALDNALFLSNFFFKLNIN
jgi:hypothetical protein